MVESKPKKTTKTSRTRTKTKTGGKDREEIDETGFGVFDRAMKKMDYCIADMKHSNLVKDRSRASKIYPLGNMVVKKTPQFIPTMD